MQQIQKTIGEFLDGSPLATVGPGDTVAAAVQVMKDAMSNAVLVLEQGELVGIFTGRDFLNRVAAAQRDPGAVAIREVMTESPECLRSHDSIAYAINRMAVRGFRNIPIVVDERRPVAMLDVRTVTAHLSEVFAEVSESIPAPTEDEWTDIGGGG